MQKEQYLKDIEVQFNELEKQGPVIVSDQEMVADLEKHITQLKQQISMLQQQVEEKDAQLAMRHDSGDAGAQVSQSQYDSLKNEYEQIKQDKDFLETFKVNDLAKQVQQLTNENKELKDQL